MIYRIFTEDRKVWSDDSNLKFLQFRRKWVTNFDFFLKLTSINSLMTRTCTVKFIS